MNTINMYLEFSKQLHNLKTEFIPRKDIAQKKLFNKLIKLAINDRNCYHNIFKREYSSETCNN